jgi:hypothetical protein
MQTITTGEIQIYCMLLVKMHKSKAHNACALGHSNETQNWVKLEKGWL